MFYILVACVLSVPAGANSCCFLSPFCLFLCSWGDFGTVGFFSDCREETETLCCCCWVLQRAICHCQLASQSCRQENSTTLTTHRLACVLSDILLLIFCRRQSQFDDRGTKVIPLFLLFFTFSFLSFSFHCRQTVRSGSVCVCVCVLGTVWQRATVLSLSLSLSFPLLPSNYSAIMPGCDWFDLLIWHWRLEKKRGRMTVLQ